MLYFISAILDVIMLAILGYIVSRIIGAKIRLFKMQGLGEKVKEKYIQILITKQIQHLRTLQD